MLFLRVIKVLCICINTHYAHYAVAVASNRADCLAVLNNHQTTIQYGVGKRAKAHLAIFNDVFTKQ